MRGKRQLYNALIPSSVAPNSLTREDHINNRRNLLAYRYYYYAHLLRKRYDDSLDYLSREFFLTPRQLTDELLKSDETIKSLINKEADPNILKKNYPWLNWSL